MRVSGDIKRDSRPQVGRARRAQRAWQDPEVKAARRDRAQPALVSLDDLHRLYRESRELNHGLVLEAVRHCAVTNTCPAWVAVALWKLLDNSRQNGRMLADWWKARQAELKHLRRASYFEDARDHFGFTREDAAEYVVAALRGTPAGGAISREAILQSEKRTAGWSSSDRYLTTIDWAWIQAQFPMSSDQVRRESKAHIETMTKKRPRK